MTARRSTSDPVSHYLETSERVVWRHQPAGRVLFYNRLPSVILIAAITAFLITVAVNVIGTSLPPLPLQPDTWLVLPAAVTLFFAVLLYFFLSTFWNHLRSLLDSWDTHYALTNRRFIVVAGRRAFKYDASYFSKMAPVGGKHGEQVLAFDWRIGHRRRYYHHDRLAGLPDAEKLERLIRETLRA